MAESGVHQRIASDLRKHFGRDIWLFKVHSDEYTGAGIPDLIGVCHGLFFGFEVKRPHAKPRNDRSEKLQAYTMSQIQDAGGCAAQVRSTADCLAALARFGIE